ncbi:MAG: YggS family pyridoxal phosphate-dependent enzyme [Longimicrobiales bacterium]
MSEPATLRSYAERLSEALPQVRDQIARAAEVSGRDAGDVRVVAVTKGHPVEAIRAALDAGLTDLGENRVAELVGKVDAVGREGVAWHMIGHIQRRKVPDLLPAVDWIHSVDSMRLAERIDRVVDAERAPVDVLVQVNTSGEDAKGGFEGPRALDDVLAVAALPALRVRGLMTMAPFVDDERVLRRAFSALRRLLDDVRRQNPDVGPHLSMGMTNDLRFAVEEGSTMVRIGTALFGARPGTAGGA